MMNKLPADVISNIKAYASDKLPPSPTAKLIKTLQFEYKDTTYDNDIFRPYRLEVTASDGRYFGKKFMGGLLESYWSIDNPHTMFLVSAKREYIISDFLPSYWSIYADTIDR